MLVLHTSHIRMNGHHTVEVRIGLQFDVFVVQCFFISFPFLSGWSQYALSHFFEQCRRSQFTYDFGPRQNAARKLNCYSFLIIHQSH